MDYFDCDVYYENLAEEEESKNNEYEYKVMMNRPRYSLEAALDFDKSFVNQLLNKEDLDKVDKHWIASMLNRTIEEYKDSNRTSKSFDDFLQGRLGEEKYMQYVNEWLRERENEFFQRAGMEEQMKPSAIYFMDIGEEE